MKPMDRGRTRAIALALLVAMPLGAEGIPGFVRWSAEDLRAKFAALEPGEANVGVAVAGEFGSDLLVLVRRDATGEAEWHERHVDVFIVHAGTATLAIGGSLAGARATGPGEKRAAGIEGGRRVPLGPGDLVRIPEGVPHQVILEKGTFEYAVLKIAVE